MRVEVRPLGSIHPYENDPRLNDAAVDAVAAFIREFGSRQPKRAVAALLLVGFFACGANSTAAGTRLRGEPDPLQRHERTGSGRAALGHDSDGLPELFRPWLVGLRS